MVWGRNTQRGSPVLITSGVLTWLDTDDVNRPRSCLSGFSTVKLVSFSLYILYSLEEVSKHCHSLHSIPCVLWSPCRFLTFFHTLRFTLCAAGTTGFDKCRESFVYHSSTIQVDSITLRNILCFPEQTPSPNPWNHCSVSSPMELPSPECLMNGTIQYVAFPV